MSGQTYEPRYRYRGPRSFSKDDEGIFFGRENEISYIYNQIWLNKTFVLFGQSGLGKSSLIQAGLIPKIKKDTAYIPVIVRFGNSQRKVRTNAPEDNADTDEFDLTEKTKSIVNAETGTTDNNFIQIIVPGDKSFYAFFKNLQSANPDGSNQYLLIFDQFEEIFSYRKKNIAQFLENLSELINIELPNRYHENWQKVKREYTGSQMEDLLFTQNNVKCLFSIRSDYLYLLNQVEKYFPLLLSYSYELKSLTKDGAEQAIIGPSEIKSNDGEVPFASPRFKIKEDTIRLIFDSLVDPESETFKIESIQLQLICDHIEKKFVIGNKDYEISESDFDDRHGKKGKDYLQNVYQTYYESNMALIKDRTNRNAMTLALAELTNEGTMKRIPANEYKLQKTYTDNKGRDFDKAMKVLEDSYLVRKDPDPKNISYELVHDTFVKSIVDSKDKLDSEQKRKARLRKIAYMAAGLAVLIFAGAFIKMTTSSKRNSALKKELYNNLNWNDTIEKKFEEAYNYNSAFAAERFKTLKQDLAIHHFFYPGNESVSILLNAIKGFQYTDTSELLGDYSKAFDTSYALAKKINSNFLLEKYIYNKNRKILLDSAARSPETFIMPEESLSMFPVLPQAFAALKNFRLSAYVSYRGLNLTSQSLNEEHTKKIYKSWEPVITKIKEVKTLFYDGYNAANSYSKLHDPADDADSVYRKFRLNLDLLNYYKIESLILMYALQDDKDAAKIAERAKNIKSLTLASNSYNINLSNFPQLKSVAISGLRYGEKPEFLNADNLKSFSGTFAVTGDILPFFKKAAMAPYLKKITSLVMESTWLDENLDLILKCSNLDSLTITVNNNLYSDSRNLKRIDFYLDKIFKAAPGLKKLSIQTADTLIIPPGISALKQLRKLIILHPLRTIPAEIESLNQSLEELRITPLYGSDEYYDTTALARNFIIPSWISKFSKLRTLEITNCRLAIIPDEVFKLPLEELNLYSNKISVIPETIGNLSGTLKFFNISFNDSLSAIPASFEKFYNLESINLEYTSVKRYPHYFINFPRLRHVAIGKDIYDYAW